jgi:hypothetical protein
MRTIHAAVNPRLLTKANRFFTSTLDGRIIELLQNARRAGAVNTLDISPFVLAMLDSGAYAAQYPGCPIALADVDDSGTADGLDIQAFVNALLNH